MSMFCEVQEQVRYLINKEEYEKAMNLCKEKLKYLADNNIEDDNCSWFFNLRLGICYRKLKQYKKAISYIHKSSLYARTQDETMQCWLTLANCHYCLGNEKFAIKFYKKCKEYYKRSNNKRNYYITWFNIEKINKNVENIKKIINNMNRVDETNCLLDNAYALLCEIYIENNQVQLALDLIHNIHSAYVRKDVENKLAEHKANLCIL